MKSKGARLSILLVLLLVFVNGQALYCEASTENPEDQLSRTLTITLNYTDQMESVPVLGAKVQVSRVADLVKIRGSYQYQLTGGYSSCDIDINTMESASASLKVAETLNNFRLKNNLNFQSGVTDSQGNVSFSFKEPGMYLVSQNGWDVSDVQYTEFAPYLVKLPMPDSDDQMVITKWNNQVVTEPKLEIKKISPKTEPPKNTSKESVVKTGDETNIFLSLGLMVGSLLFLVVVMFRRKRERRNL